MMLSRRQAALLPYYRVCRFAARRIIERRRYLMEDDAGRLIYFPTSTPAWASTAPPLLCYRLLYRSEAGPAALSAAATRRLAYKVMLITTLATLAPRF